MLKLIEKYYSIIGINFFIANLFSYGSIAFVILVGVIINIVFTMVFNMNQRDRSLGQLNVHCLNFRLQE